MTAPHILMDDDFRHGLDFTDRWAITRFPPRFSADDGIVSTSDRGLQHRRRRSSIMAELRKWSRRGN
jgi:hypothetical protein